MRSRTDFANAIEGDGDSWLHSRRWDLTFITLSVAVVTLPYLGYLGMLRLPSLLQPLSGILGATPDSVSRNIVNAACALIVGGPHMYATFFRTALDRDFAREHHRFLLVSLLVPFIVVTLAMLNLAVLLTIFFFWASVHVLHQIIYVTDLYRQKKDDGLTLFSRLADYGVILTALYPLAAWKISMGNFKIGPNDLSAVVGRVFPLGPWMVWLAGSAFALSLAVWLVNTCLEWRRGRLHYPKTLFVAFTVTASFFVPVLGNLDTAFQGMNVWHSLQYLSLTWMLNRLRYDRGELDNSPFVKRLFVPGSARRYYLLHLGLTLVNVLLIGVLFILFRYAMSHSFDLAFDRAYYIAVLSVLWVHYFHDHYLFTKPGVVR